MPGSPPTADPIRHAVLLALVLASLAWFSLPTLVATYNEGFQATMAMNAMAVLHGGLASVDPLHGLDNDFLVYSRFGVSAALAGLLRAGLAPELAFRLLMIASLALLLGANAGLLAWRYRIHPVFACVPALLFPGLFESAWFFNDNVLSAGLSSAALLLFWAGARLSATAGAALLWGLAVACRTDAALLAPAFATLGWMVLPSWRARIRHALLAGPVAVLVPVLIYAAFGLDILDILPLTRRATELWARSDSWAHVLLPAVKGFAAPGFILLGAGALHLVRARRWPEVAFCLAAPLLYLVAYGRMLSEVRYLLPLTPMFGLLMMEGWRAVLMARPTLRRWAVAALAAAFAACLVPPFGGGSRAALFMTADHDMPRLALGRFWSPLFGLAWNRSLAQGAAALDQALVQHAQPGRVVLVVSTYWTPDRMVDLLLREHGFQLAQDGLPLACRRIAERFVQDGGAAVIHLRPHVPMLPTGRTAVTWADEAVPCLQAMHADPATPLLVVGWTEPRTRAEGLSEPGITPILVPQAGGPLAPVMARRFGYMLATALPAAMPHLLQQALDAPERAAAQAVDRDPRAWAASGLSAVH